jgi:hypothetical protein
LELSEWVKPLCYYHRHILTKKSESNIVNARICGHECAQMQEKDSFDGDSCAVYLSVGGCALGGAPNDSCLRHMGGSMCGRARCCVIQGIKDLNPSGRLQRWCSSRCWIWWSRSFCVLFNDAWTAGTHGLPNLNCRQPYSSYQIVTVNRVCQPSASS